MRYILILSILYGTPVKEKIEIKKHTVITQKFHSLDECQKTGEYTVSMAHKHISDIGPLGKYDVSGYFICSPIELLDQNTVDRDFSFKLDQ